MTALTPNDRYISLSPGAGTTVLAYDFELMLAEGMSVTRVRAGIPALLALGADFSFPGGIGNETGGSLTLAVASLAGDVYLLVGAQPEQRLSDFVNSQKFDSAKMNADLDALTIVAQEHRRDIGRAWKAGYGQTGGNITTGADGALAKFKDGNLVESDANVDEILAAQEAAEDAAAAAAGAASAAAGSAGAAATSAGAAAGSAGAAAASAASVNLPAVVASTFLFAKGDASGYDVKTPAQARAIQQAIPFTELPYVEAWNNNVPGDATDQTARLTTLIGNLPPEGGNILLKGDVRVTALTALQGKHNIRIMGLGGLGTGSAQQSYLRSAQGSGNGRIIDCRDTFNVSFEKLWIEALDKTTFNGTLIDYGLITTGSSYMHMTDCFVLADSNVAGCQGMSLYGATQGSFKDVSFNGKAASGVLSLQKTVNAVGFCNAHSFTSCHFKGASGNYLMQGSGEGLVFTSCNVQAGADGVGRWWSSGLFQDFRGVDVLGCTFYDVLAATGEWIAAYRGNGLNVIGSRFGGFDTAGAYSAAIRLGGAAAGNGNDGVHGVNVLGNNSEHCSALVSFAGVIANRTHAQEVLIGGNHYTGSTNGLVSSLSVAERVTTLPNNINGASGIGTFGSGFQLYKVLPTAATGLTTGAIWANSNVLTIVP